MGIGTREANLGRLARGTLTGQNTNDITSLDIDTDEGGQRIPRRIKIEYITVQASVAASYLFRLFTRNSRVNTPGAANYSLLKELTVVNSAVLQEITDTVIYVDEDATANSYAASDTANELKATIWCEIESTTAVDVDYDVSIGFSQ